MSRTPPTLPVRIIDSHHHIWRRQDVPWLSGDPRPRIFGPYADICRNYLVDDFANDLGRSPVLKSVYMQCNWEPSRALDEVRWVQSVSDDDPAGFPHGIVSFADLADPSVGNLLRAQADSANLVGVRHQVHWHENPDWAYVGSPEVFNEASWRKGLDQVGALGLPFDLQIFPSQMQAAAGLLDEMPEMIFVLNHAGMLEDLSPERVAAWDAGMAELTARPNLVIKLSGLNTFVHELSQDLVDHVVETSLRLAGPDRVMFGSNFPIESLWTTYGDYLGAIVSATAGLGADAQDAVFYRTAARVYGLDRNDSQGTGR
jgi:predicted TIM-barrel fold metal-dependent hydrolase